MYDVCISYRYNGRYIWNVEGYSFKFKGVFKKLLKMGVEWLNVVRLNNKGKVIDEWFWIKDKGWINVKDL